MLKMTLDRSISFLLLAAFLALSACSGSDKVDNAQFAFLAGMGIDIDKRLLLPDTLTMPDVYCGDDQQTTDDLKGWQLDREQYESLIVPAGMRFADEMSNWLLLGVRDMGSGVTLAAFYAGNGLGYCVDLATYDKQGHLLDAINAREMHLLWRIDLSSLENDTVFTLDSHLTFNGDHLTLHRVMGRCVMDFDHDLKSAPVWQQAWDQDYMIDAKGHFVLLGQHVTGEKGEVDHYAALDFKAWDMLVCSLHDEAIMDTWNEYSELVNSTYDPDYQFNPFPWDISQLYHMNPQRFLMWMAAHRDAGNRLLPLFVLPAEERPALLEEINRIDDNGARQWLTALVNSWDSPHQATPPVN